MGAVFLLPFSEALRLVAHLLLAVFAGMAYLLKRCAFETAYTSFRFSGSDAELSLVKDAK